MIYRFIIAVATAMNDIQQFDFGEKLNCTYFSSKLAVLYMWSLQLGVNFLLVVMVIKTKLGLNQVHRKINRIHQISDFKLQN